MKGFWSVIRASWRAESQSKQVRRSQQEREFLPAALEIVETPALPLARLILLFICLVAYLAVLWAFIGRLDIHSVMQGQVMPAGRIKVIEPFGYSIVRQIYVKEGHEVKEGDLLVELDPTEREADLEQTISEHKTARIVATRFRVMAELGQNSASFAGLPQIADMDEQMHKLHEDHLRGEVETHQARLASIDADIVQLETERDRLVKTVETRQKVIETLKVELVRKEKLNKRKFASDQEVTLAKRAFFTEQTALVAEEGQIASAEAGTEKLRRQREEVIAMFVEKALAGRTEAERNLASLEQELIKAREREAQEIRLCGARAVMRIICRRGWAMSDGVCARIYLSPIVWACAARLTLPISALCPCRQSLRRSPNSASQPAFNRLLM